MATAYTYDQGKWSPGQPITQRKMNDIEDELVLLSQQANTAEDSIASLTNKIGTEVLSSGSSIVVAVNAANSLAQSNEASINRLSESGQQGALAWSTITNAGVTYNRETGEFTKSLKNVIDDSADDRIKNSDLNANFQSLNSDVKTAYQSGTITLEGGGTRQAQSLSEKVQDIDTKIANAQAAAESARNQANQAMTILQPAGVGQRDIQTRLNELDGGTKPDMTVPQIISEIDAARGEYQELATRFSNDEDEIAQLKNTRVKYDDIIDNLNSENGRVPLSANQGRILKNNIASSAESTLNSAKTYADDNKIDKTSITNSLSHDADDGSILDARVGKVLNSAITALQTEVNEAHYGTDGNTLNKRLTLIDEGEAPSRTLPNIISEVDAAHRASIENDTLDNRFDDVEARATAIETEIANAHRSGLINESNEPIEDTLDNRFDDLETSLNTLNSQATDAFSTINDKIDTIANELGMLNDGSIVDTNSKIDTLEAHVTSLATELGMISNGDIIDTNTRIDTLEAEIAAARGDTTNLDARLDNYDIAIDTLNTTTDALSDDLNASNSGLKARVSAIESTTDDLTGRVANLETVDATSTIVVRDATFDADGNPQIASPKSTIDYLILGADGKYYYWKYIDNTWQKISGDASTGNGNSNAEDFDTRAAFEAAAPEANKDYYVLEDDGIRHHYRYILSQDESAWTRIEIGQAIDIDKIKRYNIYVSEEGEGEDAVTYLNLYQYNYDEDNTAIDTEREVYARVALPKGGGASSTNVNRLIRIGDQIIQDITGSQILLRVFYSAHSAGGAESIAGTYTLKSGNTIIETGTLQSGEYDAKVSGWQDNTSGYYQFDVSRYCAVGNTSFTLTVDVEGVAINKAWTVNIIDLRILSDAPDTLLVNSTESYNFNYTPMGALNKTLHLLIDGVKQGSGAALNAATSGRSTSIEIPAQAHGAHTIELYLTAVIGGIERKTESIIREYIWYDVNNTNEPVILASPYNDRTITSTQYATINIPYQVYKKEAAIINVEYYLDGASTPFDRIALEDVNDGILSYLATDSGNHTITIKVDDVAIDIQLAIAELEIDVSPVKGAVIDFDPTALTNNSINRLPTWTINSNTYHLTTSENFNWSEDVSGGGYKEDKDGKCFVIKAGSYIELDYPMFAGTSTNNVLTNGSEMKIIFKTEAVRDANAIWFTNTGSLYNKTIGIQLGAHSGWLKTDKASDTATTTAGTEYVAWTANTSYAVDAVVTVEDTIYKCTAAHTSDNAFNDSNWLKIGKIDTEILATNSYLYFPYSETDKIELDININKYDANEATNFIMSYEDGVPSKAYAYTYGVSGDGLYHSNTIRIGSDDCDVYLYHLRIYNKSLNTADILQNFIADGKDIDEKIARYNKNCIYWDATQEQYFTSPSATALLDPVRLAQKLPDVKILMLDTPVFTTGKKDFVQNSTLRCIHASGGKIYASRGDADNWFFQGGLHSGQGTTSDNYGQSARNVDFLFEVDGVNYPTKAKNLKNYTPSKDYVSSVLIGENASEWVETEVGSGIYHWVGTREPTTSEICENWKGDNCKVSLTATSVPNNYFNLKTNVASSENVNNALFQKRYNDFLVYNSPAFAAQIAKHGEAYRAMGLDTSKIKVKNSMEFVPAILFVRENQVDDNGNPKGHTEFNDCNWHFYALGNIGDSKKTDYTRAYDPDDMNEFTCENSDNNTNNGQFQSGVFMYNNTRAIETDYNAWTENEAYNKNDIVIYEGKIYQYNGVEGITASWIMADWRDITPVSTATIYYAPRVNPNPMDYIYPISVEEWNLKMLVADASGKYHYVNRKHDTLVEEDFDGDHSFEFRYACCGDYRDGDLINDSTGAAKAQYALNHNVMLALYEWLLTATEEQYVAEAEEWIVKNAMEFFYAYTHYYTMMDNRAKNTFWHFAKTGTHHQVSRPVAALLHVYDELDNGVYIRTKDTEIDTEKTYYTEYAFDLWAYDMDTAAGIDNNGALVFPYGKEDEDYRVEGEVSSGYAFNGAGSIFWRRLKTTFADEIASVMNNADTACFNAEDLIEEFDNFQNCFPEEIWRLDIERKYIRTFTGASVDNSITTGKQNPRFLTSMMQGRKKYQRRQWIRDQGVYFNSKYRLTDITRNENTIEFNIITPTNANALAVKPNYNLQLTPYQDMYLNVQVGNGNYQPQIRAKAGVTYTIDLAKNTSGTFQETRIYINGFNSISGIGNLAPMYPYAFTLSALNHLKVLDIGTDNEGYNNTNLTSLPFAETLALPLLETLNIKNCNSLTGVILLNRANNIRTIEATGTAITGIALPDYTNITTLHLPSTINAINLYSARMLNDFQIINNSGNIDYSSLYTLHIYDSDYSKNINWLGIANSIIQKQNIQTDLALLKLKETTIGDISSLEPLNIFKVELQKYGNDIELSGIINVTGNWSTIERDNYMSIWPDLAFNTDNGTQQTKHQVTYRYDDYMDNEGNIIIGDVIKTLYVNDGATAPDIYADGTLDVMPDREATVRAIYEFGQIDTLTDSYIPYSGWQLAGSSTSLYESGGAPVIRQNTVIETHFEVSPRTYFVKWYMRENDESSLVKTSTAPVQYGGGENLEAPTVAEIHAANQDTCNITINNGMANYSIFTGWNKLPINIAPSAQDSTYNIYATWETGNVVIDDLFATDNLSNLTPEQLLVLSALDSSAKNTYQIGSKITTGTKVTYTLGHDNTRESGIELVNGNPLRLDGATDTSFAFNGEDGHPTIQPLKAGDDAFTLAIDYCFNPNASYGSQYSYAVLASVYYGAISTTGIRNGLSLFYGTGANISGLRVGFGDMYNNVNQSVRVGNTINLGQRNMIVLRHPKGSNTLYVYSGLSNDINNPTSVIVNTLTWSNPNSDAYLNFGRLTSENIDGSDGTPQSVTGAKGTIFWSKYWKEDLGAGECKRLAAWPHESITYAVSRLTNTSTSINRIGATAPSPSIYLSALTASAHIRVAQQRTSQINNFNGRDNSITKDICDQRIFEGLPTKLQAILCKSAISYLPVTYEYNTQTGSTYQFAQTVVPGRAYVFPYSAANVLTSQTYLNEDANANPFGWYNAENVVTYTYSSSNASWVNNNSSDPERARYLNIRFPYKSIAWSATNPLRVFRETTANISGSTQIAQTIYNSTGQLRSGDIYIDSTNTYIYVLNSEIVALGIQAMPTTGDNAKFSVSNVEATLRGGWVLADDYWTRSALFNSNGTNFVYVYKSGEVNTTTNNSASSAGLNLMYTFAI